MARAVARSKDGILGLTTGYTMANNTIQMGLSAVLHPGYILQQELVHVSGVIQTNNNIALLPRTLAAAVPLPLPAAGPPPAVANRRSPSLTLSPGSKSDATSRWACRRRTTTTVQAGGGGVRVLS
jgi:hypothetical protein